MKGKKLFVLTILCFAIKDSLATDYGPINGAMNFVNNDRVVSTNGGFAVVDNTVGGTGIQVVGGGGIAIDSLASTHLSSSGILLANGAHNDLGSSSVITVGSTGRAEGIGVSDTNGEATHLTADSLMLKSVSVGQARGINIFAPNEGAQVVLTGQNVIDVTTSSGSSNLCCTQGILITGNSTNKATFSAEQLDVFVKGGSEYVEGINLQANSSVSIGSSSSGTSYIKVNGVNSKGVISYGDAFVGNNLHISVEGTKDIKGVAISEGTLELNNSQVDSQGIGVVVYWQATAATLKNVVINAGKLYGLSAQYDSVDMTLDKVTVDLTTDQPAGAAMWSVEGAIIRANDTHITSTVTGVLASRRGKVVFSGENVIDAGTGLAISAVDAKTIIETGVAGSKMAVIGNMQADSGGTIDLTMTDTSYFKGATHSTGGVLNLAMTNSLWDLTASSTINQLALQNTQVNFVKDKTTILQVDDLSGEGQFQMTVDMASQQGQLLKVAKSTSGQFELAIHNDGSTHTNGTEKLVVVNTADGGGDFSLAHFVEAGGYQYGLRRDVANSNNWQLFATGKLTSTAQAAGGNFLNAAYLLNYVDTQTLLQRMGALRADSSQEGGLWVRGFAGKLNSFSGHKLSSYGIDYNGYQLGIDKLVSLAHGNLYVGAMAGYTHANPDYSEGTGTVKDYTAGVYGSYLDNSGIYLDAVAKYSYIKNDYNVRDTAGTKVSGTGRQKGYSLSLEVGKKWSIGQTNFYVEPQIQLTYSQMGGSSSRASNGLKVNLQGYESVLGRGSLVVGYQVNNKDNPVDLYVKSGYVREFAGNTSFKLNGSKERHDFAGGWVDSAIGITAQFNNNHHVYGEVSYANGNRFDKQQINVGYRYQF